MFLLTVSALASAASASTVELILMYEPGWTSDISEARGYALTTALLATFALLLESKARQAISPLLWIGCSAVFAVGLHWTLGGFGSTGVVLPMGFVAIECIYAALVARFLGQIMLRRPFAAFGRPRVAVFGANVFAVEVLRKVERSPSARIVGLYDDRTASRLEPDALRWLTGDVDDLIRAIQAGSVDDIVIPMPDASRERLLDVVSQLAHYSINIWLCERAPLGFRVTRSSLSPVELPNAFFTIVHTRAIYGWGYIGKAAFDRCMAGIAIILAAPLMLGIAAAIKLDSSGPVFFRQRRNGFNGDVISVWKFRSMRTMEDGIHVQQAQSRDPRVTRVGRLLRRSSLDELPQLFNILRGEMSFVGPRPHALAHNQNFERIISDYAGRHQVKPGLTGWAQVNGFRGETADAAAMEARVRCDLWYIANWSMLLDLRILLLTPIYGLLSKNAY